MLDLLASGAFAAVQLTDAGPERDDERASPAFVDAPLRYDRPVRDNDNGSFFVHRCAMSAVNS